MTKEEAIKILQERVDEINEITNRYDITALLALATAVKTLNELKELE